MEDKLDKALSLLDVQNDIEQVLPGASEEERNESRLRQLITKEPRPISHIDKETKAWAGENVILPMFIATARAARLGGRGARGIKAINDASHYKTVSGLSRNMRQARKEAVDAVKETGKALKEARKDAPKNIFQRIVYHMGGGDSDEIWAHRLAKEKAKDVDTAIKVLSQNTPGKPGEVLDEAVAKAAKKAGAGAVAASKAGKGLVDSVGKNWGEWEKGISGNDDRLEMGLPERALHFLRGLTGGDELDPSIWPMRTINELLFQTNAEADIWDSDQLENLGDDEKVKLVMDTMRGKYNDYDDVSNIMLKNYLKLTNTDEE